MKSPQIIGSMVTTDSHFFLKFSFMTPLRTSLNQAWSSLFTKRSSKTRVHSCAQHFRRSSPEDIDSFLQRHLIEGRDKYQIIVPLIAIGDKRTPAPRRTHC